MSAAGRWWSVLVLLFALSLTPFSSANDLSPSQLRVGVTGYPTWIISKVFQVIDEKSVLVGMEDARTNRGRYDQIVMLKGRTEGLTDGVPLSTWHAILRTKKFKVTGTTTYKTALGSTKTVFVIEGYEDPKPAPLTEEQKREQQRQREQQLRDQQQKQDRTLIDLLAQREVNWARKMGDKGFRQDAIRRYEEVMKKYPTYSEIDKVKRVLERLRKGEEEK